MPPKRKYLRRKRNVRPKSWPKGQTLVSISRPYSKLINSRETAVFGQSKTANYRYVEQFSITSGATSGVYTFRLNSMFDPNFTGTGHQPLFRDVMTGIFAHYRVNSCKFKLTPMIRNNQNIMFAVLATQDSGYNPAIALFPTNIEKRNVKWRYQNINTPPAIIKNTLMCHEVAGVSKKAYEDERSYSAAVGNNPSLELFLSVIMQEPGGNAATQDFMIELEYNTTYYEPFIQPQS